MAISESQKLFIEGVGELAAADMGKSGVLASLTVAQAILESGWGTSELATNANALFGIKAANGWSGRVYSKDTKECYDGVNFTDVTALFRAYDSWEESVEDHSAFLVQNSRYAAVIGETDYKTACAAIHAAGYATDPEYTDKLVNLIETYSLTDYDKVSGNNKEETQMSKIAVYAGHGGSDPGACSGTRYEKNYTLSVSNAVTAILQAAGHTVINNRTTDVDRNLTTDANRANSEAVDAVVEIHLNSNAGTPGTGAETYYSVTGRGKELATAIQNKIVALGFRNRGIKTYANSSGGDYFGIIRIPTMPSVLVETAFINNDADMSLYNVDKMAAAIAEGVMSIYGGSSASDGDSDSGSSGSVETPADGSYSKGDFVNFKGGPHYTNANATTPAGTPAAGPAEITSTSENAAHPYHLIHTDSSSAVYGWVNASDIEGLVVENGNELPYLVRVTASSLNIRTGPGTNYGTNGSINDKGVYTIVEESSGTGATVWGRLKSGAGWISLDYATKI